MGKPHWPNRVDEPEAARYRAVDMVKLAFDPAELLDISDPKEMPAYTVPEAAWALRIPTSTVRCWFFGNRDQFEPLLRPALPDPALLSFNNLVEIFVLRSALLN